MKLRKQNTSEVNPSLVTLNYIYICTRSGIAQSVWRIPTGWTVRGSNPGAGDIFRNHPDRTWRPHSLILYNEKLVIPGGKASEAWRLAPTPSNAEVKERIALYLYSPSGPSWLVLG